MVQSRMAAPLLLAACAMSSSLNCGEAIGKDNSHDAAAIAACKACKGEKAFIDWKPYDADSTGYSYCKAGAQLSSSLDCGEAIYKDNSHDAAAIAACKACKGEKAFIDWQPYDADGLGYSYCKAGAELSTPPDCGEAYAKDTSHDADAIAACKACKGPNAKLIYDGGMLDSIGMTYCSASLATPPDCGEAYAKDTSHDADAIAACKACKGPNAKLIYDGGMLDSIGMTYCSASMATPPDCGEAYAKDTSHDADAIAACKACKGPNAKLIYDGGMLDSIGMTYCQAAHTADLLV